ncbi:hypothetical protein JTE90_015354 [Oedothorax gibbosus]|uniref:Gamma-glutamyltranspeptidase 1 n=1 Tax=Oedothorax gibbosus TaxID=931172 RepID=A0AAV6U1R8_9ARAC|nr:hypothetical protein JTE90_015354 [Oedothorax gibbosus]
MEKAYQYDFELGSPLGVQKWDVGAKEDTRLKRSLTLKAKVALSVAFVITVLVVTVIVVCFVMRTTEKDQWLPEFDSPSRLGRYECAAVSTDAAPCAPIGRDILAKNGSVVDAVIAVLLCMGVVNPQSCGLGGGFLMMYYNRTLGRAFYLDAREVAPAKANATMFHGNASLAQHGGLSIAVPAEVAGYYAAHENFGVLPWEDLFPPAIKMCEEGLRVNFHLANALKRYSETIKKFEHIRKIFVSHETGEVLQLNDTYTRPDLAKTLRVLANEKMNALYGDGSLAKSFLADLKAAGSIIDESDMRRYAPRFLEPVQKGLRDNVTLYSTSLPGSGMLLAFMLGVLDGFDDINCETRKDK